MAPKKVSASKGVSKSGRGAAARGRDRGGAGPSTSTPSAVGAVVDVPMIVGKYSIL